MKEAFMDFHIGEILLVAFNFVPAGGFLACNGQILPISSYYALFSLVGTRYGGDGITTFAVPNMTAPTGLRYLICYSGVYPSRPY